MTENEIVREVVDAAYKIHTSLGPGLLESVYEAVLAYELRKRGLNVIRQKPIPDSSDMRRVPQAHVRRIRRRRIRDVVQLSRVQEDPPAIVHGRNREVGGGSRVAAGERLGRKAAKPRARAYTSSSPREEIDSRKAAKTQRKEIQE